MIKTIKYGLWAIGGLLLFCGLWFVISGNLLGQSTASPPITFPTIVSGCTTSQKAEAAADANVLTCNIPAVPASYRVRFVLSISASNTATLGWTVAWTDSNGNAQAPANVPGLAAATAGSATSFLTQGFSGITGSLFGYQDLDTTGAAPIVVKLTFTGTSFAGKASATVERLI